MDRTPASLRRMEPRELLAAAEDAMAKRGIQRSLPAVFRDFITAWDNASPERRARFASDYRDQLEGFCHEIGGSPKSVTGGTRDLFNSAAAHDPVIFRVAPSTPV